MASVRPKNRRKTFSERTREYEEKNGEIKIRQCQEEIHWIRAGINGADCIDPIHGQEQTENL